LGSLAAGGVSLIGAGDTHCQLNVGNRGKNAALIKKVLADPTAWAFNAGDLVHSGKAIEYQTYYHRDWGSFKDRTLFCMGNHDSEYAVPGGVEYNRYTGAPRYYAKTLGSWRIYVLNCSEASKGGASAAEQTAWLKADLPIWSPAYHIAAMVHYPMFSSVCEYHTGLHNGVPKDMTWKGKVGPWWRVLQEHGCEFAISGHAHRMERLRPMLADGTASRNGIRQYVIGTGGVLLRNIVPPAHPNSEAIVVQHGVERFDLYPDRYEWQFINVAGVVQDRGVQSCRKVLA
jgi:hypothetical protein